MHPHRNTTTVYLPYSPFVVSRFVYHRETTLSIDNILQVLYCAKKCLIHPLIEVCRAKFKDLLDVNNVGWLYEAVSVQWCHV